MELKEAIYGRRAIRDYTPAAVEESGIRNVIDAAIHAPSAINQQPWRFTVVRDAKKMLSRISSEAKAYTLRKPPRKGAAATIAVVGVVLAS